MTSGEDLVLIALVPRSGRIREADRLKYALRASVLVDLALAHRITMNANRIKVLDAARTGDGRLDSALASLSANSAPTLGSWIKDTPAGFGMVNRYLSILADQGVLHLERHRGRLAAPMLATLLDPARRDAAVARINRVARGRESDDADRALAGLIHACGLDRHLYRFSPLARMRISRLRSYQEVADSAASSAAVEEAAVAQIVAQAVSDGIAQLTAELGKLLRYEYRIEHTGAIDHHGTSPSHHGGYGDSGSGHHHGH
ncbi:GPP34 family phosphoprotein [Actinospica sp. MGRD01-02]|uniref:GPP34 family phosphoprotein n=1 Tax=Actinospica acidithermotolerans TaxID=2828514 RepID=A0A941IHY6_9ACTN|nr:GPP34 family phosphoprotein [Actinospica acidithermotolerans]MBR7827744.1 GPP34 family phosphoprotein [Actinospica acidithermotolerans]